MEGFSKKIAANELIIAHMSGLQGMINRFASNSASCKTMCLTLIAALLALMASNKEPQTLKVSYAIIGLMAWLDGYYSGLEREIIKYHKSCAIKIQNGEFTNANLYEVEIHGRGITGIVNGFKSILSPSLWPFYLILLCSLIIVKWYFAYFQ